MVVEGLLVLECGSTRFHHSYDPDDCCYGEFKTFIETLAVRHVCGFREVPRRAAIVRYLMSARTDALCSSVSALRRSREETNSDCWAYARIGWGTFTHKVLNSAVILLTGIIGIVTIGLSWLGLSALFSFLKQVPPCCRIRIADCF
jgi:hypothetical protein